jgi:hypothetical protein
MMLRFPSTFKKLPRFCNIHLRTEFAPRCPSQSNLTWCNLRDWLVGVASGIKTKEIVAGVGEIANRNDIVLTHIHGFLHRGEECLNTHANGQPMRIDLSKREAVAGLRKGIEGMRVGGKREIVVSPHLAYGAEGVPGRIPPNAIIRFEVELLSILKAGEEHDHTTTLSVTVFHPGEAARNLARWQFGFGGADPCGVIITCPRPGVTWRYAHSRPVELSFSPSERADLLHSSESNPPTIHRREPFNFSRYAVANVASDRYTRSASLFLPRTRRAAAAT